MNNIYTQLQIAIQHHQTGEIEQAQQLYKSILQREPKNHEVLHLLGVINAQIGNYEFAEKLIMMACQILPKNEAYQFNLGNIKKDLIKNEEAIEAYTKAIKLNTNYYQAYFARGNIYLDKKDYETAILNFKKAVQINSKYKEALTNLGNCYEKTKKFELALNQYEIILKIEKNNVGALINKGNIHIALKNYNEANKIYDALLEIDENNEDAYFNKGICYFEIKNYVESLKFINRCIELNKHHIDALNTKGQIYKNLGQYENSEIMFKQCIEINSKFISAYINLAGLYIENKKEKQALDIIDIGILQNPNSAQIYASQGAIYLKINLLKEAQDSFEKAYQMESLNIKIIVNLADNLFERKEFTKAIEYYEKALALDDSYKYLLGPYLQSKMSVCNWSRLKEIKINLIDRINNKSIFMHPLPLLAVTDSILIQKKVSINFTTDIHEEKNILGKFNNLNKNKKLKIAYFSGDYINHPVAYLTIQLFEMHDRENFDVIGMSYGTKPRDTMTEKIEKVFDKFIDCSNNTDIEIAKLAREMGIDIAIDLSGYTQNGRPNIFSFRVAPIQISYLGFPGTMGSKYIDYIIGDKYLIPEHYADLYTEKIIYIPSYQVSNTNREVSTKQLNKNEYGLPEDKFIYCCFNNTFKITPSIFDRWSEILKEVKDSVLWLLGDMPEIQENLKAEIEKRGVNGNRIIFAERVSNAEYIARFKLANLFLDTFPFNAGTTANDALWAGLPILTYSGEAYASRMAGSLLTALDVKELIAKSENEYVSMAIEFAKNTEKLNCLHEKIRKNKYNSKLFNTLNTTKKIEEAYIKAYEIYKKNLPVMNIHLDLTK